MIKSFRHKGIQQFFETGSKAGRTAEHADNIKTIVVIECSKAASK